MTIKNQFFYHFRLEKKNNNFVDHFLKEAIFFKCHKIAYFFFLHSYVSGRGFSANRLTRGICKHFFLYPYDAHNKAKKKKMWKQQHQASQLRSGILFFFFYRIIEKKPVHVCRLAVGRLIFL